MTDFTPTPEAVEAVALAIHEQRFKSDPLAYAQAAIAAFVEAEGFEVQRTVEADGDLTPQERPLIPDIYVPRSRAEAAEARAARAEAARSDVLLAQQRFRDERKRAETAEAKVAELANKLAESEEARGRLESALPTPQPWPSSPRSHRATPLHRIRLEEATGEASKWFIKAEELEARLHQATEALREARRDVVAVATAGFDSTRGERANAALAKIDAALATLTGEDDDAPR